VNSGTGTRFKIGSSSQTGTKPGPECRTIIRIFEIIKIWENKSLKPRANQQVTIGFRLGITWNGYFRNRIRTGPRVPAWGGGGAGEKPKPEVF